MRRAARSSGFGRLWSLDPDGPGEAAGGAAALAVHAADDDHGAAELRRRHLAQHVDAVAVLQHEIERHAIEAGGAKLLDRVRHGRRHGDFVTGLLGSDRDQAALRGVVIDHEELKRAPLGTVGQI